VADYKQVNRLSDVEAAYIAGIIDGEGTISLSRRHKSDNRQLVVTISSTERQLLEYIQVAAGAGRITSKKTYSPDHAPGLTYAIDNRQALNLLEQISPYLKTYKAQRAALVLENYVELTPRNGRYSEELLNKREAFIQQFMNTLPHA
jgi:hypothetical protein